ncbi:hypothetical protein CYMTET_14314 [Cymbomonas tetramitiformis]|uniref:Uncharacterized protein n=1 Tax=Cymbomonas tetramitiformis TaxID=36881 RepID=A0AAE0GGM1_9CHLO|nr:hypothetical protein CYMTET_14314 [Cymbomonas tetramitiformis]
MGNLMGKPTKKGNITDADRAMLDMKTQKRKLVEYNKRLEIAIQLAREKARGLLAEKHRDRALQALKQKKFLEETTSRVDEQITQLLFTIGKIQEAQQSQQLFDVMKQSNLALKEIQSQIKVEEVERLVEDLNEARDHHDYVNQLIAEHQTVEANELAEKELEALEDVLMTERLPTVPSDRPAEPQSLPDVPTTIPTLNPDGAEALRQAAGEGVVRMEEPLPA